jgi:NADPH:quinone reductase-like Zn-dependent oxidoreductase
LADIKVQARNREVPPGTCEALWYVAPGRTEIRSETLPEADSVEVRVRTLFSGISRGTERLVFGGRVPESEYERMRAPFMGGDFPFPVKYGYAAVGLVEQGPPAVAGSVVFALHPHQDAFNVPAEAILPLPEGLPPERAVLAANMETALNAVWDAQPGPADRIAVVGGGVVGALVAWLCGRVPGARVTLVDIEPSRAELALGLGVSFARPGEPTGDCDLVVHASGTGEGLSTALSLAGMEATVLEMSWYGTGKVPVALGAAFHSRRLRLISSQVGQVAPSHRPRWTHRLRLAAALDLLRDDDLDALLAPPVDFRDLPARLPAILSPQSGVLCQLVRYPGA